MVVEATVCVIEHVKTFVVFVPTPFHHPVGCSSKDVRYTGLTGLSGDPRCGLLLLLLLPGSLWLTLMRQCRLSLSAGVIAFRGGDG